MISLFIYAIAVLYFCWMSHNVSQACLVYRARHNGEKAGFAGFVIWVCLAVFPTLILVYLGS